MSIRDRGKMKWRSASFIKLAFEMTSGMFWIKRFATSFELLEGGRRTPRREIATRGVDQVNQQLVETETYTQ